MKTISVENRRERCHRWILLGAALAVGWATRAEAATGTPALGNQGAERSAEARAANVAGGELNLPDREFLAAALGACRQQAELAATGVMRAASSDVRSLAQQLATDYRSLSDSLEAIWRRTGSAAEKTPAGVAESDRGLVDKSGAAFDREFVRVVTRENSRILTAFEQAASTARDPGVRDLAARHLPILRAHRTTLTELNKEYE